MIMIVKLRGKICETASLKTWSGSTEVDLPGVGTWFHGSGPPRSNSAPYVRSVGIIAAASYSRKSPCQRNAQLMA
jgi:hypothetical protein